MLNSTVCVISSNVILSGSPSTDSDDDCSFPPGCVVNCRSISIPFDTEHCWFIGSEAVSTEIDRATRIGDGDVAGIIFIMPLQGSFEGTVDDSFESFVCLKSSTFAVEVQL